MCGRYAASRQAEDLVGVFEVTKWDPAETLAPDWNVAPTKQVHVILDRPDKETGDPEPVRQLRVVRWGLVPSWAKNPDGAARLINARSETVHEKPSFRRPFVSRRCLIPADGYYEWGLPAEGRGRVTGAEERALEEAGRRKRPRKQHVSRGDHHP